MSITRFLKQARRIWFWLFLLIAAFGAAGALTGRFLEPEYKALVSVDVFRLAGSQTADYDYDGYYAVLAADEFSKNIRFWLQSPRALSEASGAVMEKEFSEKTFSVKKLSPQYLKIEYGARSVQEAESVSVWLSAFLREKALALDNLSSGGTAFAVEAGKPLIWRARPGNIRAGLFSGLFLGVIFSLIAVFLKLKPVEDEDRR